MRPRHAAVAVLAAALALPAQAAAKQPRPPTMSYERAYGVASLAAGALSLSTDGFGTPSVDSCRRVNRTRWRCRISATVPNDAGTPSTYKGPRLCRSTATAQWQVVESVNTGRRYYRAIAPYQEPRCA